MTDFSDISPTAELLTRLERVERRVTELERKMKVIIEYIEGLREVGEWWQAVKKEQKRQDELTNSTTSTS